MIKFIITTGYLRTVVRKINRSKSEPTGIVLVGEGFIILFKDKDYTITVIAEMIASVVHRDHMEFLKVPRFEWVESLLRAVPEQPVNVTLSQYQINIEFQY